MNTSYKSEKGFTLIELIVAVSIFIVIMTISMGSVVSVVEANRKSRSLKTALSNLNLTLETISKEMRFGKNYHCGNSGTLTSPQNCVSGGTFITFLSSDNIQIAYRITGTRIEKQIGSGSFVPITGSEVFIDQLRFFVAGATASDNLQPKVLIIVKSHAGAGKSQTNLNLETLVSQRSLDS